MALRRILFIPDPHLRAIAEPVTAVNAGIKTLIKDMFQTMYDAPGIGLAAPQIGVMKRVLVIDCARRAAEETAEAAGTEEIEEEPDPIAMVNPQIIWFSERTRVHEEGCLSIPDYYEDVERPDTIKVRYLNEKGETIERDASGLLSTCIQHEVDHLNGKLFIDYLSRLKRERVTKKFAKAARRAS